MEKQTEKEDLRVIRTKRDLANALEELLQEKNFDDLSVKDITDKAMISKNTFYNNFESKDDLLMFLFRRYRDEIFESVKPLMDHYVRGLRLVYLKKIMENIVHYFFSGKKPIIQMIKNDTSKGLFWDLNVFIQEIFQLINDNYDHILTSKISPLLTSYFYSGGFASMLYFCCKDNIERTENDVLKAVVKLTMPLVE